MTSRFVHLAVVDALFVAISETRSELATAAQAKAYAAVAEHRL
jgi:DNA-binding MurR/RpiR family transcriptional regulator